MAFNIFKKKEEESVPEKKSEVLEQKPVVKKADVKMPKIKKKNYTPDHEVLNSPHITEKATDATGENKYIFKVGVKANKIEVKKAVESYYGVDVKSVNMINIHRKQKIVGRNIGWVKGYKKAIVSVKEGQKIEIMPR